MKKFQEMVEELEALIAKTYEEGTTLDEAEKHAAQFLHAQLAVSRELSKADLDSRMRKSGVKAIRGATYITIVSQADKKPTEAAIEAEINTGSVLAKEQDEYDKAETSKAELQRLYDVFANGHIYYRGIAKGKFE